MSFAGTHLLIDLSGAENLDDLPAIETALKEAALAGGATILNSDLHHFEPNGGVSGVVILAESHITIHTWPEKGFAALDVFMCGECDPTSRSQSSSAPSSRPPFRSVKAAEACRSKFAAYRQIGWNDDPEMVHGNFARRLGAAAQNA